MSTTSSVGSSRRPSSAAEPEPPRPRPRQGESPRELEALPTALISGSQQLCDPFSLSSRFSPVTYRLRDNSLMLSPSVAKAAAIASGISSFASSFYPPDTPPRLWQVWSSPPPAVSAGCGDIPAPSAAAGLLPALGAVPATAPGLLCAVAGSSLAKSLPRSRCPPSPPPWLAGAWSCSHLLLGDRHPQPPQRGCSPAWHLSALPQSKAAANHHLLLLLLAVFPPSLHLPGSPCGNCLTALHKKCTCPLGCVTAADGQAASIAPERARRPGSSAPHPS